MSSRSCAFLAAFTTLLASGVLYHALARDSSTLDDAASRVTQVPTVVGVWQGRDETPDDAAFAQAGAKAYWTRVYTHPNNKTSVLVILMCGRAGKMAVHTPEVCYGGAGFELQTAAKIREFKNEQGAKPSQFWTAHFVKKSAVPSQLRLYWAWNALGAWEAASSPRWQFRGEPFLYKVYVSCDVGQTSSTASSTDPAAEFLHVFLPVLNKTLFPN